MLPSSDEKDKFGTDENQSVSPSSNGFHHQGNGKTHRPGKPTALTVKPDAIPEELKQLRIWSGWQYRWSDEKKKWAKVPIDVDRGQPASSTDPATWSSFQKALEYYQRAGNEADGIGLFFNKADRLVGADIDHCVTDRVLNDKAISILTRLNTYAEMSPSETGVKAIAVLDSPGLEKGFNNRQAGVEMYDTARFWTVTGHQVVPFQNTVHNRTSVIAELVKQFGPSGPSPVQRGEELGTTGRSVEEVLQILKNIKEPRIRKLVENTVEIGVDYPSESEADMALTRYVARWIGNDPEPIWAVIRGLPRGKRGKWQRQDYAIDLTIRNVLDTMGPDELILQEPLADWADPHRLAQAVWERHGQHPDGSRLRSYQGNWFLWEPGRCFRLLDKHEMESLMNRWVKAELDTLYPEMCKVAEEREEEKPKIPKVTCTLVGNVLQALSGFEQVLLAKSVELNSWLNPDGSITRRNLLAVANGLLDLGRFLADDPDFLMPHSPRWFSTVCLPYAYDPSATCDPLDNFFRINLEGDSDRINISEEWMGYLLLPSLKHQAFLLVPGDGENGKGVFFSIQEALLGSENTSAVPPEDFDKQFHLRTTLGKLVNISSDTNYIERLAEGPLKRFTVGDPMTFDVKHQTPITTRPTAKLVVGTNELPRVRDRSDAVWRRMLLMPFRVKIGKKDKIKGMDKPEWWAGHRPGLLNRALAGLKRLEKQQDFTISTICEQAKQEYRHDTNPARAFHEAHCRQQPGALVPVTGLHDAYILWFGLQRYQNQKPLHQSAFGKEVLAAFPHLNHLKLAEKPYRKQVRNPTTGKQEWHYLDLEYNPDGFDEKPCNQESPAVTRAPGDTES